MLIIISRKLHRALRETKGSENGFAIDFALKTAGIERQSLYGSSRDLTMNFLLILRWIFIENCRHRASKQYTGAQGI